jgi:queuine tRNA-ribosyltransferase
LVRAEEMLAPRLLSLHNLRYLHRLVERAHAAISERRYQEWALDWGQRYFAGDIPTWFSAAVAEG